MNLQKCHLRPGYLTVHDSPGVHSEVSWPGQSCPRGILAPVHAMSIFTYLLMYRSETDKSDVKRRKAVASTEGAESLYTIGSKLRVKYGKGSNQKIYEAKVCGKNRKCDTMVTNQNQITACFGF